MPAHRGRRHFRWWWAAIVAATLMAYAPALRAPFAFDDISAIPGNPSIRRLTPLSVPLSPPPNTAVSGRPLVNLSLAVNYRLNEVLGVDQRPSPAGPNKTLGFHVVNLALHGLCGFLVFVLLRGTFNRQQFDAGIADHAEWLAMAATALWLLHPIQSEAVNYLVQRTELLVSLAYLALFWLATRAWTSGSASWYATSVLACLMGMLSKEVMFTAPFALAIFDRVFYAGAWATMWADRKRVAFYAALGITSVAVLATIAGGARAGTAGLNSGMTPVAYALSQGWAIAHYLRLALIPYGLTFDYGYRAMTGASVMIGLVVVLLLAALTIAAWTRLARWGWAAFLGTWFFLTLAPSSSVVPIATEIAAERRVYLAVLSVFVLVVIAGELLSRRYEQRRRLIARGFVVACVVLAATTFVRSITYASTESLWRDVVRKAPENARGYQSLASTLVFSEPPRLFEAETLLREAIARDSMYLPAWSGLAAVLIDMDKSDEAIATLVRALRIEPGNDDATAMLGRQLLRRGDATNAVPFLERHARAYPSDDAFAALGTAYLMVGRGEDGFSALRQALSLNPTRTDALRTLGGALAEQGRAAEALPLLEAAVKGDTLSALSRGLLALALSDLGRPADASQQAAIAVANANGNANILILAGRAELQAGRPAIAETYFAEAVQLAPANQGAREWMARARTARR